MARKTSSWIDMDSARTDSANSSIKYGWPPFFCFESAFRAIHGRARVSRPLSNPNSSKSVYDIPPGCIARLHLAALPVIEWASAAAPADLTGASLMSKSKDDESRDDDDSSLSSIGDVAPPSPPPVDRSLLRRRFVSRVSLTTTFFLQSPPLEVPPSPVSSFCLAVRSSVTLLFSAIATAATQSRHFR